jgi:hypothetical protein
LAVTVTVAGNVNDDPLAGLVIDTDGGTFGGLIVMCTGTDVVVAPSESVATAVSVYGPDSGLVQVTLNGLVVSTPSETPFAKNATC